MWTILTSIFTVTPSILRDTTLNHNFISSVGQQSSHISTLSKVDLAWTNFISEFPTKQEKIIIYVRKHLVFQAHPPRSLNFSRLDSYLWGNYTLVHSAPVENKDTLHKRNLYAPQTRRNCPRTLKFCYILWSSVSMCSVITWKHQFQCIMSAVRYYVIRVFITECILPIKLKKHSFPYMRLYEVFFVLMQNILFGKS